MKLNNQLCLAFTGVASLMAASTCAAAVVYEASYNGQDSLPYYYSGNAYGDEIVLAGTQRVLTEFHFAYYSDYSQADGLNFTLYANDGPLVNGFASPGSVLFSDTYDVVLGTSGVDIDIPFTPDPSDPLPDRLTFVVEFLGTGIAGLLIADDPTIGASGNDFWEWNAGSWELRQLAGGYTSNFEARVTAVPEANPGVAATMALAGLGVLAAYRRSQKK